MCKSLFECCPWLNLCRWFYNEPKFLIKVFISMIAFGFTLFQVTKISMKLKTQADATHTFLGVNHSLFYPAVTFCQEPPFRMSDTAKLLDSHDEDPKDINGLLNKWAANLSKNVTDESSELFLDYISPVSMSAMENIQEIRFNGETQHVKVESTFSYILGYCHTVIPIIPIHMVGKKFGFNFSLVHDKTNFDKNDYGWHVYIHEANHKFDDHCVYDGRAEYMFLNIGEQVEAKLKPRTFVRNSHCKSELQVAECFRDCVYNKIIRKIECQAPWMNFPDIPVCPVESESFSLLLLLGSNSSFINQEECKCHRTCKVTVYDSLIEHSYQASKIQPPTKQSKLLLYFTSKAVTYSVEQSLYGFVQYMADLGGTLSFYIGISVLTLVGLVEKIFQILFDDGDGSELENDDKVGVGTNKPGEVVPRKLSLLSSKWSYCSACSVDTIRTFEEELKNIKRP